MDVDEDSLVAAEASRSECHLPTAFPAEFAIFTSSAIRNEMLLCPSLWPTSFLFCVLILISILLPEEAVPTKRTREGRNRMVKSMKSGSSNSFKKMLQNEDGTYSTPKLTLGAGIFAATVYGTLLLNHQLKQQNGPAGFVPPMPFNPLFLHPHQFGRK